MGIPDILLLNPKRLQRILDFKHKEELKKTNNSLSLVWYLGRLCAVAFNNPQKYPERPLTCSDSTEKPSRETQLLAWREYVKRNRA